MSDSNKNDTPSIHPARVAVKALLLFLAFNLVYAAVRASPGWFIVIRRGGYERFPALWLPDVHNDGSVSIGREMFSNMDVLFASHILTRPKAADEFRVFIFGDSSVWGTALYPEQTVAGQINQLDLRTCSGQRVVAYNLGYPSNSATKDLLFMQRAQQYQPDLNVWLFSMLAFQRIRQDVPFVVDNPLAVQELMTEYGLPHDASKLSVPPDPLWGATIAGQRRDLNLLVRLQASTLLLGALGMDDPRIVHEGGIHFQDTPKASNDFFGIFPPANLSGYLAYETLPVASAITGGKIIYVGEPIEISTGVFSDISYNSFFPRWAYDQFRQVVSGMSAEGGWTYLDLWNIIPEQQFSTSIFHLLPEGEAALAARLSETILLSACP
ncbi:MAG: hypothetical protein FD146_2199 [Anaerolineaceae bacterium]|nr:MAG: hypothetical protein FD146_2199 [Anaerolineaceae bacterium]